MQQVLYAGLIALALAGVTGIVLGVSAAVDHRATAVPYCPPDPRDCD